MFVLQAIGFQGDIRKREDAASVLESTVKHFGKLDILVNAAAGNFLVPAEDLSPNGFRTGSLFFCHEFCIVNFKSFDKVDRMLVGWLVG